MPRLTDLGVGVRLVLVHDGVGIGFAERIEDQDEELTFEVLDLKGEYIGVVSEYRHLGARGHSHWADGSVTMFAPELTPDEHAVQMLLEIGEP